MTTDTTTRVRRSLDARLDEADRSPPPRTWLGVGAAAAAIAAVAVAWRCSVNAARPAPGPAVVVDARAATVAGYATSSRRRSASTSRSTWPRLDGVRPPQRLVEGRRSPYGASRADSGVLHPDGEDRNFSMLTPSLTSTLQTTTRTSRTSPPRLRHDAERPPPTWLPGTDSRHARDGDRAAIARRRRSTGARRVVMTGSSSTSTAARPRSVRRPTPTQPYDARTREPAGTDQCSAIVDGGSAGPLLIYDAMNTSNPDKAGLAGTAGRRAEHGGAGLSARATGVRSRRLAPRRCAAQPARSRTATGLPSRVEQRDPLRVAGEVGARGPHLGEAAHEPVVAGAGAGSRDDQRGPRSGCRTGR